MSLRRTLAYAVLVAAAVVYLYPFVIQVATSLKTDPDASATPVLPSRRRYFSDDDPALRTRTRSVTTAPAPGSR